METIVRKQKNVSYPAKFSCFSLVSHLFCFLFCLPEVVARRAKGQVWSPSPPLILFKVVFFYSKQRASCEPPFLAVDQIAA